MAIKRADKLRNVANVAKELIADPTQTEREVAAKLGINRSTVNRAKEELREIAPKDEILSKILAGDFEFQLLAQTEMNRRVTQKPEEVLASDLKGFSELAFKRSQLLSGWATERFDIGNILSEIQSENDE